MTIKIKVYLFLLLAKTLAAFLQGSTVDDSSIVLIERCSAVAGVNTAAAAVNCCSAVTAIDEILNDSSIVLTAVAAEDNVILST